MNKEIRDYQEFMFIGLVFRQCFFSVLAILAAVGIYFRVHNTLGEEVIGWLKEMLDDLTTRDQWMMFSLLTIFPPVRYRSSRKSKNSIHIFCIVL